MPSSRGPTHGAEGFYVIDITVITCPPTAVSPGPGWMSFHIGRFTGKSSPSIEDVETHHRMQHRPAVALAARGPADDRSGSIDYGKISSLLSRSCGDVADVDHDGHHAGAKAAPGSAVYS